MSVTTQQYRDGHGPFLLAVEMASLSIKKAIEMEAKMDDTTIELVEQKYRG